MYSEHNVPKRHFTQSFAVVGAMIEKDHKILLVQENQGDDKGKWNQPAGWLDIGEDPIVAVKREIKEETGLDFTPTALMGIYSLAKKYRIKPDGGFAHGVKLIFRGHVTGSFMEPNDEIGQLKWFSLEEIEQDAGNLLRDADIKQEARDYFANKSYPLEIIHHTVVE